ncbi:MULTISPECIES: sulfatase-like hydrolase/transferase [unclassified Saccharothrix]|uniref:sulfatase-like hydrolase/transferase n=1 Tax=unclassified Saccharothrix TaxID=2593673 RepID=UPI00307F31F9
MPARVVSGAAVVLVLFALVAPGDLDQFSVGAFLRVPVEGLLGVLLVLVVPGRARWVVAGVGGAVLGLVVVLKLLDIGFDLVLYRPFDPVLDWPLFEPALDFVSVTAGPVAVVAAVVVAAVVVLGLVVLSVLAVLRLSRVAVRRRLLATRVVAVLAVAWITLALPGVPVASDSAATFVYEHARQVRVGLHDREAFAASASVDPFGDVPGERLLTSLRGKDVVVVFVESYGRVALDDVGVTRVLDDGTRRLSAAGFGSRSAFLTSSTAGGGSWLAHATLLSGLYVDNQQRYRTLVSSDRMTLNSAFARAGWRTVGVMPGITRAWPEGAFFGYDCVYPADRLGYRGPRFGYATTPDQFTLEAFERLERGRGPVMATIPLVTSHAPWGPVPRMVPWESLGDGSVFGTMTAGEVAPEAIFSRDPRQVRADYGRSVEYSVETLVSYVEHYGDDELVLVFVGDHQPAQVVTGSGASRDVPVTVVARDPGVVERVAGWGWEEGLRPGGDAPVWPMEGFRDRFLGAF